GAHSKLHCAHFIEMTDQLVCGDGDETWRKSALGYKRVIRTFGDTAYGPCDFDVFGEIEVVRARTTCRLGDTDAAIEGQAGNHGIHGVALQMRIERLGIAGIEGMRVKMRQSMSVDDGRRGRRAHIAQMHLVGTRLREQSRNQSTNFTGAQNENSMHVSD